MPAAMQVMRLDAPGEMLRRVEEPIPVPGAGEVLVKIRHAGINHRDLWIQKGMYSSMALPCILGSDAVGEVVGGDDEPKWRGRDILILPSLEWGSDDKAQGPRFRILGMPDAGTFAQYIRVPCENIFAKPAHLSDPAAAALPLAGLTAYRALFTRARLQPGERILLTGIGGGVALMALQFCLAQGAEVFVTSSQEPKLKKAKELGAAGGVKYSTPAWKEELLALAGDFDCILDSAGGDSFQELPDVLKPGGRLVCIGATRGNPPGLPLRKIFWRQATLLGSTMGSPTEFSAMLRFVEEKRIEPLVDRTFPLGEVNQALQRMDTGAQMGKLVLSV